MVVGIVLFGGTVVLGGLIGLAGIRIVRPTEVGVVERLGKYTGTMKQGFHWIIPVFDSMYKVNMTERMADIEPQEVITKDKLNAHIDAVVYYQIKDAMKSLYNVDNHRRQLTSLARTTLRAVIGRMTLTDANENRAKINDQVEHVLDKETESYGVEVLRVEIQRIDPPKDVQGAMNEVVKAEQKKIAALDTATALETEADGTRRAEIKVAQGQRQSAILQAEGDAQAVTLRANAEAGAIKVVSESADKYFKGNAQKLKALDVAQKTFSRNSKLIIDGNTNLNTLVSDISGAQILPFPQKKKRKK